MFRIEMFPAREGDCLILTYGEPGALKRILIDGGRSATYADLRTHLVGLPQIELFESDIIRHGGAMAPAKIVDHHGLVPGAQQAANRV